MTRADRSPGRRQNERRPQAVCHCGAPLYFVATEDRCPACHRVLCALCRAASRREQCPKAVR